MQLLALLGRQPALGLAELESLYGSKAITPLLGGGALLEVDPRKIHFSRHGGTIKLIEIVKRLDTIEWSMIERYLIPACKEHAEYEPEGKLTIGISSLGLGVSTKQLERTALQIKKAIKQSGRPVRIIPNKSHEISTPQVIHNRLTEPGGWELFLYRDGRTTLLGRTLYVQDIEGYTARDQARPMRDARVGMLPPKLAQILINLSCGAISEGTVLDPFCGTGVVLQEAKLMGMGAYGTDIEPRMIEYSRKNIDWLATKFSLKSTPTHIEAGDAITTQWEEQFTAVACEGYLGLPFAHLPSPTQLQESIQSSNTIMKGFLKNLARQTPSGFRACIGAPAWHVKGKVHHLPCLEQLEAIGWKRQSFVHAKQRDMVYQREDQIVGRELVVLVRA